MKREIIFRGKRIENGEWIQGYLFCCWECAYIAWGMVNDNADMKEVDPETVCQYTGLTDKNGRKIFEGDILSFAQKGQNANGKVKMVDGCFFAIIEGQKCWLSEGIKRYKGRIISNIYDNPELLRGA